MKTPIERFQFVILASLLIACGGAIPAQAFTTTFTYQGVLKSSGIPVNGQRDFRVSLYSQASGGLPVGNPNVNQFPCVSMVNGAFTLNLNFGDATAYDLKDRWIEIAVSPCGANTWQSLGQRIQLLSTPNAIQSQVAATVAPNGVSASSIADGAISQKKIAAGQVVTSVNGIHDALTITGGAGVTVTPNGSSLQISVPGLGSGWALGGNANTSPNANFIGTTDNQPMVIRANNVAAFRVEPHVPGAASIAGGYFQNNLNGVTGGVIGGGGTSGSINELLGNYSVVAGGHGNKAGAFSGVLSGAYNTAAGVQSLVGGGLANSNLADRAFLGGGTNNLIRAGAILSTLGGGAGNIIGADATRSTLGGGNGNQVLGSANFLGGGSNNRAENFNSTVGGGANNVADGNASVVSGGSENHASGDHATLGGGQSNFVLGHHSVVAGGRGNSASGNLASVLGGAGNEASGLASTAVGFNAKARHEGSLVIADLVDAEFASTQPNELSIRSRGGVRLSPETSLFFGDTAASTIKGDQGGSIELGDSTNDGGQPYIDFHFGVKAPANGIPDWSVRLINNADRWLTLDGNLSVQNGDLNLQTGDISLAGGHSVRSAGRLHIQASEDLFLNPWADAGPVHIGGGGAQGNLIVHGNASVGTLTTRGGADLAEPFQMSSDDVRPGALVVIDEEHEGQLKLTAEPYDKRAAGIVSGANGVNPGIRLHQEGRIDTGTDVALTGRVYALADASHGPIRPGDLLTSSDKPGYIMKVTDFTRAQGAVVGKAMGTLRDGTGYVLVLVTLQ